MKGRACGKVILVGEHAVVHGHPAIAVPVDLHTEVEIFEEEGPLLVDHDLLSPRHEDRLEAALEEIFPEGGRRIEIHSQLPVGVGLGSSAALAVAVSRALGLDEEQLRETAMRMERSFHGDPSGLDVAVALRGEAIWYTKGKPMKVVSRPKAALVVIDSGTSGDTEAMVAGVAERTGSSKALRDVLEDIGALVHAARAVLEDPYSLGELLTENHGLLRQLGVSTPALDQIVDMAIGAGAHGAKLSGAGGGGVCVALIDDPAPLVRSAESSGLDAWIVHQPS